jgi:hypothetical protein
MGEKSTNITAHALAQRFSWLKSFDEAELSEIAMCATDERLEPGEEYFDVSHPERGVIKVEGDARPAIPEGACIVSRKQTSARAWNKLIGRPGR